MINRIDWLNAGNWTKGFVLDDKGERVRNIAHEDATQFDLYAALKLSYFDEDEFEEAVGKVKKTFKMLFPDKYRKVEENYYYRRNGKLVYYTPLYALNDRLDTFADVRRILFYL